MGHALPLELTLDDLYRGEESARAPFTLRLAAAITVTVRDWRGMRDDASIADWDELAARASEPNPFYESWFLLPSLESFDQAGKVSLFTVEVGGELVGIMPVRQEVAYYGNPMPHFRAWTHANSFLAVPLVAAGFEEVFWSELLAWADQNCGTVAFLHLTHQPVGTRLDNALRTILDSTGRNAATVLREERAMLASELSADAYFANSLSTKKRKELRRQERRLGEEGKLDFESSDDAQDIAEWVDEFLSLEKSGWKGKEGSALACDERTTNLFAKALSGAAQRGKLERRTVRLDGKPIAMLANFLAAPGGFSFKTTFDEAYARFSPGVLLQCKNLSNLERSDIMWVDSCAAEDHPMIDHLWRERREIACYSVAIGGPLRRAIFDRIARYETGRTPGGL